MISPLKPSDIEGLVEVARLSQLIEVASLKLLKAQFKSSYKGFSTPEDELSAFADHLVLVGALTQWQCDHLLAGKHRGFFLETYVLQSRIRTENLSTVYAERDLTTGNNVVLRIFPPSRISANKDFVVEVISEDSGRGTAT